MIVGVLRRVTGTLAAAGVVVVLAADPGLARVPVSKASASAATVRLGGQSTGTGEFVATNDGGRERTAGRNTPMLPVLEQQATVVGGSLGQDATAAKDGTSAACAGLVSRNGTVEVGPHGRCLTNSRGRVVLSLGSLDQLGLGDVLTKLPKLPEIPGLPDPSSLPELELRIEGSAVTAQCSATPQVARGSASVADAEVVAVVAGQRVPIAGIPSGGLGLGLDDLLAKLPEVPGLSDPIKALLDQLPADQLPTGDLLTIATNKQTRRGGGITVTALRVAVVPDTLADLAIGTVSCGPNHVLAHRTPPTPTSSPTPPAPEPTEVPTAVPAGLASMPGDEVTAARPVSASGPVGFGILALLGLAGLTIGGLLHRRRHG
ncbi:hypothetical protein [Actinopolymorpha alba]|uniref:hypothetical protein n=1 Tax=Actinopolymorpha alba TaxID=533267 RepID=UPI000378127F|nr:hypothetical protein [Actinopolymorpha alba]